MINIMFIPPQSFKYNHLVIWDHSQKIHKTLVHQDSFLLNSSPKITVLKILEVMNQNQLYKLNCLCHVFSQVAYRCSRGYISISSAKNNEFIKITKFVSLFHFLQNFPFSKQNKLDPSHHSLNTTKHLNW
jgi:hypothetical protein